MVFNLINFHGHLRLSGVCKRWHNLICSDALFMRTVKLEAGRITKNHKLMRSYQYVALIASRSSSKDYYPRSNINQDNLQKLLKNAETIDFGSTNREVLNCVMPLCENLREIRLHNVHTTSLLNGYNGTMLTFEPYPLPVRILATNPVSDFIDRLKVVTNISGLVFKGGVYGPKWETFMAKHGAVIKTLSVEATLPQLELLGQIENLHLQSLCLGNKYCSEFKVESVQPFLAKQAPFLESYEISGGSSKRVLFNSIWILSNLKTVKFTCSPNETADLRLNNLKTLAKLERLDLELESFYGEAYQLDISELTTLAVLRLRGDARVRFESPFLPLLRMEKIEISCYLLNLKDLNRIVKAMPGLKVLALEVSVGKPIYCLSPWY
jgi:hypothetical protein